ncbi:MAG: hypothetical protein GF346_09220 [Candidatus Eisenbacteria bacterium]|nr:hypothetical protein [Candidatus Latescibacterota bacterium]MBD3302611.1 hypothetical protein [Candidatus Eisenbacteria bacterium]
MSTRRKKTARGALAVAVALFLLASCAEDEPFVPQETPIDADQEIQEGWALFRELDPRAALIPFGRVADRFPADPRGHVGLGWCRIELDSIRTALEDLRTAALLGDEPDGHAGLAVAASALGLDSLAVAAATRIEDPGYRFTGDPDFGYPDLLYIRALGLFHLGRYEECYAALRTLDPAITIDLEAYDFRERLFRALESLRGIV